MENGDNWRHSFERVIPNALYGTRVYWSIFLDMQKLNE